MLLCDCLTEQYYITRIHGSSGMVSDVYPVWEGEKDNRKIQKHCKIGGRAPGNATQGTKSVGGDLPTMICKAEVTGSLMPTVE